MGRPIAFNNSTKKSKTLRKGKIEVSLDRSITPTSQGLKWYNSIDPGNSVVFVTDSYSTSHSPLASATPTFYTSPSNSDADILATINKLPERRNSQDFTDLAAALLWVESAGYYIKEKNVNELPSDGLQTYITTNKLASYPYGGDLIHDLSGNNLDFVNVWGQYNSGHYINSGQQAYTTSTNVLDTDYHTIAFVIKFKSNASFPEGWTGGWQKFFGYTPSGTDRSPGIWRFPSERRIHWRYDPGNTGANFGKDASYNQFDLDTYYHVCGVKNGSSLKIYVNGVLVNNGTAAFPKTAGSSPMRLFEYYNSELMEMHSLVVYNRSLDDSEVSKLYYQADLPTNGLKLGFDRDNVMSMPYNIRSVNSWNDLQGTGIVSGFGGKNHTWMNDISQISIVTLIEKTGVGAGYAHHPVAKWNSGTGNASFVLYHFENYQNNNQDGQLGFYANTANNGWTGLVNYGFYRMQVGEIALVIFQYHKDQGGSVWVNNEARQLNSGTRGLLGPSSRGLSYSTNQIYGPQQTGYSKIHKCFMYDRLLDAFERERIYNTFKPFIKK